LLFNELLRNSIYAIVDVNWAVSAISYTRWQMVVNRKFKKIYSKAINFDSLVKSRKTTCLQEGLVFGVLCLVLKHLDITSEVSYQTRNTKHMMGLA